MSSLILVERRFFNYSTSHNVVYNTFSVNKRYFMVDLRACFTDFTRASQVPSTQGDEGGLNNHSVSEIHSSVTKRFTVVC